MTKPYGSVVGSSFLPFIARTVLAGLVSRNVFSITNFKFLIDSLMNFQGSGAPGFSGLGAEL
jgi:hypothetical protein